MATKYIIEVLSIDEAIKVAKEYAKDKFTPEMEAVLKAALYDKDRVPSLKIRSTGTISLSEYIKKWVDSYLGGFYKRPSLKVANPSGTVPDSLMPSLLSAIFQNESEEDIKKMIAGHTFLMPLENLVGDLLEEYLSNKLGAAGWYCAWGSTIDAVDFCHLDGRLLQIKNSDNSENSSSSRVRKDTPILKWFRRYSTKEDTFNWEELKNLTKVDNISEEDFREWAVAAIKANPKCIHF